MRIVYERCATLDVHKKTLVACAITPKRRETVTFGTMTRPLWAPTVADRTPSPSRGDGEHRGLLEADLQHLEAGDFEVLAVNARHVKAMPGRKTDVKDAERLADLLRHGLPKPSYIPDRWQRELRELVRYRKTLIEERSRLVTRVQKLFEGANIKLGDVACDVMGASGRAMLKQLAAGKKYTAKMARLAQSNLRNRIPELDHALTGSVGKHQRSLLAGLIRLAELEDEIARLDEGSEGSGDGHRSLNAYRDLPITQGRAVLPRPLTSHPRPEAARTRRPAQRSAIAGPWL